MIPPLNARAIRLSPAGGVGRARVAAAFAGGGLGIGGGECCSRSRSAEADGCESRYCAMISFATVVPSAAHVGQSTAWPTHPLTGSTSKAYFCPQPQRILIGITRQSFCLSRLCVNNGNPAKGSLFVSAYS